MSWVFFIPTVTKCPFILYDPPPNPYPKPHFESEKRLQTRWAVGPHKDRKNRYTNRHTQTLTPPTTASCHPLYQYWKQPWVVSAVNSSDFKSPVFFHRCSWACQWIAWQSTGGIKKQRALSCVRACSHTNNRLLWRTHVRCLQTTADHYRRVREWQGPEWLRRAVSRLYLVHGIDSGCSYLSLSGGGGCISCSQAVMERRAGRQ